MKSYLVRWEIDIDANTPEKAVEEAVKIMQDKDSLALCFEVEYTENGELTYSIIDLTEKE